MMLRAGLPITVALLAGFSLAQVPDAPPERVSQFRADLTLLRASVDAALEMASEDNPLRRASQCNQLADALSREVRQATAAGQLHRAGEHGRLLQDVLLHGVADNLELAQYTIPTETWPVQDVQNFSKLVTGISQSVEQQVKHLPASAAKNSMQALAQQVKSAHERIEKILKSPAPPRGKGPPWGKGLFPPRKPR